MTAKEDFCVILVMIEYLDSCTRQNMSEGLFENSENLVSLLWPDACYHSWASWSTWFEHMQMHLGASCRVALCSKL